MASSEVFSQVLFTSDRAAEEKQNGFCRYVMTNKVTLLADSYSTCVVYTKTIIHLSVGEGGGYLPPLRWIIVKFFSASIDASDIPPKTIKHFEANDFVTKHNN